MKEVDDWARSKDSAFAMPMPDEPITPDHPFLSPASGARQPASEPLMPRPPALFDLPDLAPGRRGRVVRSASAMTRRLFGHLLPENARPGTATGAFPPLPVQLTLPLPRRTRTAAGTPDPTTLPLFREARAIEPVLSYKQASLQTILPGATASPAMSSDDLVLPGGSGLVLYEAQAGAMAFDWMRWSGKGADQLGATIDALALSKGNRGLRRLARRRCVVPLMRYSVPVRDGAIWSHRWIEPTDGPVACAAGVWNARRDGENIFAMVTGLNGQTPDGPLILTEDEVLLWLRAPLDEALAIIAERRAQHVASVSL